jgi:protein phosphatase
VATIGSVVELANASVRAHAGEAGQLGMGSTLVGAFVVRNADEESIVVVNVGDSRCYTLIDGRLSQVTRDHSHVQELVDAGLITPDAAANHPERNVVTRAIGIEELVAGDFYVLPTVPRLRLLLCSDGVSGELGFDAMASVLSSVEHPVAAAEALIASVLEGRAADNATAIVVDVQRTDTATAVTAGDDIDVTGPRPVVAVDPEITAPAPRPLPPPSPGTAAVSALISVVPNSPAFSAPPASRPVAEANSIIDDVPR